jgi:hypothetical protein
MMRVLAVLALVAAAAFAADVARVEGLGSHVPSDADDLTYFDGTPWWYTWGGVYRGTWFDAEEFYGFATTFHIEAAEYWFYHGSTGVWDTSDVYLEVWNGDQMGPTAQLDQQMVTASHYAPTTATYDPYVECEQNFWLAVNTELSAGGWPSILGDNSPDDVDHCFFSDDGIVWEPWIIQGPTSNSYWMTASGEANLSDTSWGSIKALY